MTAFTNKEIDVLIKLMPQTFDYDNGKFNLDHVKINEVCKENLSQDEIQNFKEKLGL